MGMRQLSGLLAEHGWPQSWKTVNNHIVRKNQKDQETQGAAMQQPVVTMIMEGLQHKLSDGFTNAWCNRTLDISIHSETFTLN